jgi:phosphoglycerate dehydrogenase-like enzyme
MAGIESRSDPLRVLISRQALAEFGGALPARFADRPWTPVLAGEDPPQDQARAQIAFISREITGSSTKFEISPTLGAFYEVLRSAAGLRWLHVHSAGADRPIYRELAARGVVVTTSAGANAQNVAVSAVAGLLALSRRFPMLMAAQSEGRWSPLMGEAMPPDLAGQRVVIVGWGPVGQAIARRLLAFDLQVSVVRRSAGLACFDPTLPVVCGPGTPPQQAGGSPGLRAWAYADLTQAVRDAHWLVLACPLTDLTEGLVDARVLAALPRGAGLINVARGEVLDEAAFIEAVRGAHLGGAHLDVFQHEPLPPDSPLWALPGVILTPHAAGHSTGNRARVASLFLDNLGRWLQGEPLRNVVPSAV